MYKLYVQTIALIVFLCGISYDFVWHIENSKKTSPKVIS